MAFRTSHDAKNPCGYLLKADGESLVYMTDTGCFLEENLPYIKNPTYLIIESLFSQVWGSSESILEKTSLQEAQISS